MAARRRTVRLYRLGRLKGEKVLTIDDARDLVLRKVLDEWVDELMGTGKFVITQWSMVVHTVGGGMVRAKVTVNSDLVTVVKR